MEELQITIDKRDCYTGSQKPSLYNRLAYIGFSNRGHLITGVCDRPAWQVKAGDAVSFAVETFCICRAHPRSRVEDESWGEGWMLSIRQIPSRSPVSGGLQVFIQMGFQHILKYTVHPMFWGPCSYNSGFLLAIFIKSFMRVLLWLVMSNT